MRAQCESAAGLSFTFGRKPQYHRRHANPPHLRCAGRLGLLSLICLALRTADAGSATWNLNPASGDWNTAINWTPATVPNSANDTATFNTSTKTAVTFSAATEVASIVFNTGASAYSITVPDDSFKPLNVSGAGIVNNSGVTQTLTSLGFGEINFTGSATVDDKVSLVGSIGFGEFSQAGSAIITGNGGFGDNASAGNAIITCRPTLVASQQIAFDDDSTAAQATLIAEPALPDGVIGANINFAGDATAGDATAMAMGGTYVNINGGGNISFKDKATAGNATLMAFGGPTAAEEERLSFPNTPSAGPRAWNFLATACSKFSSRSACKSGGWRVLSRRPLLESVADRSQ